MNTSVIRDIVSFFSLLLETIKLLGQVIVSIRRLKSFELDELIDEITAGNLNYGTKVTVTGIFSDFVPVARNLVLPIQDLSVPFDPLPCRPFPINGYYCASLQSFDSKFAADPEGFPIFYTDTTPRPMMSILSSLTVEVKGTLMSIPNEWTRFLELKRPACIKVDTIDIVGAEKLSFGTIPWAIVKSKKPFLKPFKGNLIHSKRIWWCTSRLGASSRYLMMSGGAPRIRHGNLNEPFDTVHDFYAVNLANEQEYETHKSALSARVRGRTVDAQFDMATLPLRQTRWLRKQIGLK